MLTMEAIKNAVIPLAKKYQIAKVDLFGSYAVGKATEQSDADFLVTFERQVPSIFKVMGFQEELKNILNHPVDIVTLPLPKQHELDIEKVINIYDGTQ